MSRLLYLSDAAIDALDIEPGVLRGALAHAFGLHAQRRTQVQPKATLALNSGHFFQSMSSASAAMGYAAHKWVGVAGDNAARGLPTVNSLLVLSEVASGMPVAVLDANSLTALRTAAMSALAAEYLARPDSRSIGFVGCGVQARAHLRALRDLLPGLGQAICVSRSPESAQRLAAVARAGGLDASCSSEPEAALACDVVVTSVPMSDELRPFLDAAHLRPGSFVAAVDLARSWHAETLRSLDIIATDDTDQASEPSTQVRLGFSGPFDADLRDLVTGAKPGRTTPDQRALFLFPGFALADLAAAVAILEAARRAGSGVVLPR